MTSLRNRLQAWFGVRSDVAAPQTGALRSLAPTSPISAEPDLFSLADGLADEAACPADLLTAFDSLMTLRRMETGVGDGPSSPRLSNLRVRRSGLPDWWMEGENLLLMGSGAVMPELKASEFAPPPRRSVVVLGARSLFNHFNLGGPGALIVLGDDVSAHSGAMSCFGRSSVLIGEGATCTNWATLDCRNGGIILVGADGMWAHGVSLMTDDTHAIRDAQTGQRLNGFGGSIVVDRHVWLCEHARLLAGARVGADVVVGAGAVVKRGVVPANTVAVGAPARPVRSGITWSRDDAP